MNRKAFFWGAVAGGATVLLQLVWNTFQFGGERATTAFSDLIGIPVPLAASFACWLVARTEQGRVRRGWILIGAATFSWAAGEVVWSYYEVLGGREVPFPSLADVGFLGMIPFSVAAMLSFPAVRTAWCRGSARCSTGC